MLIIQKQSKSVCAIMGTQKLSDTITYRPTVFCKQVACSEGLLLYHSMTSEMLLLEVNESLNSPVLRAFLVEHWFLVPLDFHEAHLCDQIKRVINLLKKEQNSINHYTIFTTTDCNARCFYCFEKGQQRISMTEKTAQDVAAYMLSNANREKIKIRWFGGEPLVNNHVIDIISEELQKNGVEYESTMVSNAYLFDERIAERAAKLWHLKHMLITIDGTEKVYNRTKAFIYHDESPYRRVLQNVERILNSGIRVTVNMNMDYSNAKDLFDLADQLGKRFSRFQLFSARAVLLVEYVGKIHAFESTQMALDSFSALSNTLDEYGIRERRRLLTGPILHNCMADDDHSVTILPDGRLGRCEHFGDCDEVGNIYGAWDEAKVNAWKARKPTMVDCPQCVHYPLCMRLVKCNSISGTCNELTLKQRELVLEDRMLNTFEIWKNNGGKNEVDM